MSGDLVPERRDQRASHEDRDLVAERLRDAAGNGQLTAEELDERLEIALTARTFGDLEKVVADLPAAHGRKGKEEASLTTTAGSIRRDGRWDVPRRLKVALASGSVVLDLTRANLTYPTLDLDVSVQSGSVVIIVGPGMEVDVDDVSVVSGSVKRRIPESGQHRLDVTVCGSVLSGMVSIRPPRRSFWAWLTRQPYPGF